MSQFNLNRALLQFRYSAYLPITVIGVLFLSIYWSTFGFLMERWKIDPAAQHGWLIIPIALIVVLSKRKRLPLVPLSSNPGGIWVIAFALLLHLSEKALDLNGPSPLSIPIFVAGAVWYLGGNALLWELAFPIAYLLFMLPIPGGFTEVVSFPLRLMATKFSRIIAGWCGVYTMGAGMNIEFLQPRGYEIIRLEVADPCSGLHSLMALKALHAITAYLSRLSLGWKWVLFMCAIPIALAANLTRIVSIILLGAYVNKDFALGLWHEASSPMLFVIAFAILVFDWEVPRMGNRRTPSYILVIVMMTIALGASIAFSHKPETVVLSADVHRIPTRLGEWRSLGDVPLDEQTMKDMKADSFVQRTYVNPSGKMVEMLIVYRRYGRREFAHRPELCFPAAGYSLTKNKNAPLFYAGRDISAKYMTATQSGRPDVSITYFFASGKKAESDFIRQQLWMAFERLVPNKNGWTFVRLTTPMARLLSRTTTTPMSPEESLAAQQDFMRTFAPAIEEAITTDTPGAATTVSGTGGTVSPAAAKPVKTAADTPHGGA